MDANYEDEIDLMELLLVIKSKLLIILLAAVVCGGSAFLYTSRCITPLYRASIRLIVNSRIDPYTQLTVTDVTNAKDLVDTYATVIRSNRVMEKVVENIGGDMDWPTLSGKVSVSQVQNTPVMDIAVTDSSPEKAVAIVNVIAEVAPDMIVEAVEAGSCKVISDAYCSGVPVSPNAKKNAVMGFLAGGVLCAGIYLVLHLLNDKILSEEQLGEITGVPVLSSIPLETVRTAAFKKVRRINSEAKAGA